MKKSAIMTPILAVTAALSGCGEFFDCYDASFVGASSYHLIVIEKASGKRREPHTTAGSGTILTIMGWKAGDELVVCNAMITNKTRNQSATCGDFGCLALWP